MEEVGVIGMAPTTKMVRKTKKSRATLNGGVMNTPLTAKEAEELQNIADLANGGGAYVNTVSRPPEIPEDILDHLNLTLERVDSHGDGTVTLVYLDDRGKRLRWRPRLPIRSGCQDKLETRSTRLAQQTL